MNTDNIEIEKIFKNKTYNDKDKKEMVTLLNKLIQEFINKLK